MKLWLIILGFLIVAAGVFFILRDKAPGGANKQADFQISVLDRDVFKKSPAEEGFVKIEKEATVIGGGQVKTSASGRASILEPSGSILNIGKNSTITLVAANSNGDVSKIKLEAGDIWSKIKRLGGVNYEIETENMVAAVRGTTFVVRFFEGLSEILVLEGKVKVQIKDLKTGELLPDLFIEVDENFKILINSKNMPNVPDDLKVLDITDEDMNLEIIKYNIGTLESTPTPIPTKVNPTPIPSPTVSGSPAPSPSTTPTTTPTLPLPTSTPQATPVPQTEIHYVTPKEIDLAQGGQFAINGKKLTGTRSVQLGGQNLSFFTVDDLTIFATVKQGTAPGVYDVSITTSANEHLTLPKALTVK